jgi:hypothetical protein
LLQSWRREPRNSFISLAHQKGGDRSCQRRAIAVSASGLVKTRVTPLLTAEEVDAALKKTVAYRPPGR